MQFSNYSVLMMEPNVKVQVLFPKSMIRRMEKIKESIGLDRSNLIRQAVGEWLDSYESRKKGAGRGNGPR